MSENPRDMAPTAEEIERRFRSWGVTAARPVLRGGLEMLRFTRGYEWEAHFEHDLDGMEPPLIFAANHRSHADTVAILGTLPSALRRRTVVAAALDVFGTASHSGWRRRISKNCLQFVVAAGFHAFAFDRLGPPLRSVRTSVQLIRNGWNLLLYPEGTRSHNCEMTSFKPGVSLLAKFTGRPVIPIHVDGGEAILPHGVFMPQSAIANVRYGEPLWFAENETPPSFAMRLEAAVRELGSRQPIVYRPAPAPARFARTLLTRSPQPAGAHHPY
jgi:1-acyl-sn-glycerol-3-phosphate acyltransferase